MHDTIYISFLERCYTAL